MKLKSSNSNKIFLNISPNLFISFPFFYIKNEKY